MGVKCRGLGWGVAAIFAGLCASAAPAQAVDLYVGIGGDTAANDCTDAGDPCDVVRAIEDVAQDGDTVHIASGEGDNYVLSEDLYFPEDLTVIGAGTTETTLVSENDDFENAIYTSTGSSIRDLTISTFFESAVSLGRGSSLNRVTAVTTADNSSGCSAQGGAAWILNSVCRGTGTGGRGVLLDNGLIGGADLTLTNVTAWASGTDGDALEARDSLGMIEPSTITVRNSILSSVGPGTGRDINIDALNDTVTNVDLDYSHYSSDVANNNGGITPAGTLNNVLAPPPALFTSAAGNFRQELASPTVDRGSPAFADGLDIDGGPRSVNAKGLSCAPLPDIGADEYATAVAPPASCTPPVSAPQPVTKPKCKKKKKKKAKKRSADAAAKKKKKKRRCR